MASHYHAIFILFYLLLDILGYSDGSVFATGQSVPAYWRHYNEDWELVVRVNFELDIDPNDHKIELSKVANSL
jgi:hypothetical protein